MVLVLGAFSLPAVAQEATQPPAVAEEVVVDEIVINDPWVGFNRSMYKFNDGLDKAIIAPAARGYRAVVPKPIRQGVSNFFENLADIIAAINNLLQGKPKEALSDTARVLVNTTLGVGGLFDIASRMKLEKHHEDFGQTLAVWGVKNGPYIVLPILGPSTLRDTTGTIVDVSMHPLSTVNEDEIIYSTVGLYVVDERAELLEASDIMEQAALDPYIFQRDAYYQSRQHAIKDGDSKHFSDF
ncbi:hypothetical protein BOW52_04490 [Solemya elarraichensis gill symbiont]|uniref:ABC transporter n=2 Tax=Solemya elarraichensis gill symbiont TaxID=1918949 RepID=A0A1T2L8U0_9GAMM|nr:hypothetical protein BOW52_04490 [Solemya elarraichensis gill symbiont]